MTDNDSGFPADTPATADDDLTTETSAPAEDLGEPRADRMPTEDEERAAERAAAGIDVDEVAEHYEDMAERGANVRGEGQIEP